LDIPKSAEDMLETYAGEEKELLKNLSKLKANKEKEAKTVAEIKSLVVEANVPHSAEVLLEKYQGREEELRKNLRRMSSQSTEDKEAKTVALSPFSSSSSSVVSNKLDVSQRVQRSSSKKKTYNDLIKEKQDTKRSQRVLTQ